jgi:hypothetical protein
MGRKKSTDLHIDLGAMPEPTPVSALSHDAELPTLTMDEMKEIQAQARAEVDAELKAKLRSDFLAKTKSDMKKKALFVEGSGDRGQFVERIRIDLPKFSDRITLDGTIYFHGATYPFAPATAAVVKEVMNRQWLHHAEINGLDMNDYVGMKPHNAVLTQRSV